MKTEYIIKENWKTVQCEQIESHIIFKLEWKEIIQNMNWYDINNIRYLNKKYDLWIDFKYIK